MRLDSLDSRLGRALAHLVLVALPLAVSGCANLGYAGSAQTLERERFEQNPEWLAVEEVPELRQAGEHDCGITALDMVLRHWGASVDAETRARKGPEERWSAGELRDVARDNGFQAFVVPGTVEDLVHELKAGRPAVVGTAKPVITGGYAAHFEVIVGFNAQAKKVATLDPATGLRENSMGGFLEEWLPTESVLLVVLPPKTRLKPSEPQERESAPLAAAAP